MQTIVYAHIGREQLREKAKELNLSEKASHYFSYFNEVELKLEVDQVTGKVMSVEIAK